MEEKDALFEIRQLPSADNLGEMYFHYYFKRGVSVALICVFAFYFMLGLLLLAFNIMMQKYDINTVILLLLSGGGILYRYVRYRSCSKYAYKRAEEPGGIREVVIKVERDKIYPEGREDAALHISDIRRAYVTTNLVYLVTRARHIMVFEKDSFTLGSCEGFLSFLENRGIRVPKKK